MENWLSLVALSVHASAIAAPDEAAARPLGAAGGGIVLTATVTGALYAEPPMKPTARTRYVYVFPAMAVASSSSTAFSPFVWPTLAKPVQPAPAQRSTSVQNSLSA